MNHEHQAKLALVAALTLSDWPRVNPPPDPGTTRLPGVPGVPVALPSGTWFLRAAEEMHVPKIGDDGTVKSVESTRGFPADVAQAVDKLAAAIDRNPRNLSPSVLFDSAGVMLRACHDVTPKQLASILTLTETEASGLLSAIVTACAGYPDE